MITACLITAAVLGGTCLGCIAKRWYTAAILAGAVAAVLVIACTPVVGAS